MAHNEVKFADFIGQTVVARIVSSQGITGKCLAADRLGYTDSRCKCVVV